MNPNFFYLLVSCLSHQIHLLSLPRSSNCVSDVTLPFLTSSSSDGCLQPLLHDNFGVFLFFFFYEFIYLFMAVLGLRFCARAFSSCGERAPLFIAVHGPLTIAASLVAEHRLQMRRLSSCGSQAQLLRGMWNLPRPGLEPVSPALAGGFSTTAPPGKPSSSFLKCWIPLHLL